MTKLCDSIDTLAMAYLDDELAEEETRDLELHVVECAPCREHVTSERATLGELRRQIAAPRAPDLLRARVTRALDQEDAAVSRAMRRQRVIGWALPGAAALMAVGALALFVLARPSSDATEPLSKQAVRTIEQGEPLFRAGLGPTNFTSPSIDLVGTRQAQERRTAQFFYRISAGSRSYAVEVVALPADNVNLGTAERVDINGRPLWVDRADDRDLVMFVGDDGYAYVFTSKDLDLPQLVDLVIHSNIAAQVAGSLHR